MNRNKVFRGGTRALPTALLAASDTSMGAGRCDVTIINAGSDWGDKGRSRED